jgi:hypothetical protein
MSRYAFPSNEDQQPITWLAGHAIYAAHFIVLVFVASLFATTIAMAFGASHLFSWISFSSEDVLRGQAWRVVTYGLINPPSIGFVVDMFMIVWFGRELEKFFGRRTFFILYGGLYLITPLLFTLLGLRWPLALAGAPGALALFTAFATLYPHAAVCYGILAKWAAALLIGIYALIHLSQNDWPQLLALGATVGFAHVFVRYAQGHITIPRLPARKPRESKSIRSDDSEPRRAKTAPDPKEAAMAEMDALLDRIAKSGISSLTAKERARLEAARESLINSPKTSRH